MQAAEVGVRREKARPFIPLFALNGFQTPFEMIQAGIFGLGPNSSLNQWTGRFDFSLQPLWQLENLGLGNLALIKAQRGMESLAIIDLFDTQDMVAEEVNQAHARVQSAAARVVQADRALRTASSPSTDGRGPGADQPLRRRPGADQPAAGGGLRAAAPAAGLRRVLHDGGGVQPGAVRALPRAGLPGPRGGAAPAPRRGPAGGHRRGRAYLPPVGNGPPPATR